MARCQRYGRALSLMMLDIDHFKKINDECGHIAGDHVLREVAQGIAKKVRKEQCLARYGGEEFALVMPETELENARQFAEKQRAAILELCLDARRLEATPVHEFVDLMART